MLVALLALCFYFRMRVANTNIFGGLREKCYLCGVYRG